MAVDKKVIDYVKNQLKAGYTPEQIRTALANSGYNQVDINQAMSAAGAGPHVKGAKPAPKAAGAAKIPMIGFALSVVAGLLLLLATLLPFAGITVFGDVFSFFPVLILIADASILMILGILFPVIILIGAFLTKTMPDNKAPGLIVLVISIISLLMLPGSFLGALLGIIGGALAVVGK